jgi:hypothetical protein
MGLLWSIRNSCTVQGVSLTHTTHFPLLKDGKRLVMSNLEEARRIAGDAKYTRGSGLVEQTDNSHCGAPK